MAFKGYVEDIEPYFLNKAERNQLKKGKFRYDDDPEKPNADKLPPEIIASYYHEGDSTTYVAGCIEIPGPEEEEIPIQLDIDKSQFGLPGGDVNFGETDDVGIWRECKEEVGLLIDLDSIKTAYATEITKNHHFKKFFILKVANCANRDQIHFQISKGKEVEHIAVVPKSKLLELILDEDQVIKSTHGEVLLRHYWPEHASKINQRPYQPTDPSTFSLDGPVEQCSLCSTPIQPMLIPLNNPRLIKAGGNYHLITRNSITRWKESARQSARGVFEDNLRQFNSRLLGSVYYADNCVLAIMLICEHCRREVRKASHSLNGLPRKVAIQSVINDTENKPLPKWVGMLERRDAQLGSWKNAQFPLEVKARLEQLEESAARTGQIMDLKTLSKMSPQQLLNIGIGKSNMEAMLVIRNVRSTLQKRLDMIQKVRSVSTKFI